MDLEQRENLSSNLLDAIKLFSEGIETNEIIDKKAILG